MFDVYLRIAVTFGSGLIAYGLLKRVKKNRFLHSAMLIMYAIWHLPLAISIVLPFTFPMRQPSNIGTIIGILILVHIIQFGGVFAYSHAHTNNRKKHISITVDSKPPLIYVFLGYLTPLLLLVDVFLIKRISFSLDLEGNREILFESSSNIISLLAAVCSGISTYLLNWIFTIKEGGKIKFRFYCFLPYASTVFIYFIVGSRQYFIAGAVLILLNYIYTYKPKLRLLAGALTRAGVITVPLLLAVQFFRGFSSAENSELASLIFSLIKIEFIQGHPLSNILSLDSPLTAVLALLYIYYGVLYDVLASLIETVEPYAPFTSLTFPVIYRRWSVFFGFPTQDEIRDYFHSQLASNYSIFPRVWHTMFANFYLEGGLLYLILVSLVLFYAHYALVKNYLLFLSKDNITYLVTFYSIIILGIMFFPPYISSFFFFVIATLLKPYHNLFLGKSKSKVFHASSQ